ncbi:MAG: SDR family NAD(P)-dependent oxidoreductase [Caldimonas sp.]
MADSNNKFAIVTGASSGIGRQLAELCARNHHDLLIAADDAGIHHAADELRRLGVSVDAVQADLSTPEGVDRLWSAANGRPVDVLLANAGHGLGHAFLDQEWTDIRHVMDTNVTGTIYLVHRVARDMRMRREGRILLTGSIAGLMPGSFQAVYNGTKAFIDSFSFALRNELKDSGVTVTVLMPGPTDTQFFRRAQMMDTRVGVQKKDDPADVAQAGFDAMMNGEGDVVAGWKNKVQAAVAHVTPASMLAEQHRKVAEPGSADADAAMERNAGTSGRTQGNGRVTDDAMTWGRLLVPALAGAAIATLALQRVGTPNRRDPLRKVRRSF